MVTLMEVKGVMMKKLCRGCVCIVLFKCVDGCSDFCEEWWLLVSVIIVGAQGDKR